MTERNLPVKVVLQKTSDITKNGGGGGIKFFREVTPELQNEMVSKFESLLDFYNELFDLNNNIPAIGKIKVLDDAIAKSHKPNDFCKNLPIIGSEDLGEIYIRLTRKGINETIKLIKNPPSKKFLANMTTIQDILPITAEAKISTSLVEAALSDEFRNIKGEIKVKLFDFDNESDDEQISNYFFSNIKILDLEKNMKEIKYGEELRYFKLSVSTFDEIEKIASINGVRTVDYFQSYSQPLNFETAGADPIELDDDFQECETIIGIIDGGTSLKNRFIEPFVVAREEYVSKDYQNPKHATFIASTILYGNLLNGITCDKSRMFKFVDIVAIPNSDPKYGPVDSISEIELMEIIDNVMKKYSSSVKIWNLSIGLAGRICQNSISDLAIFLDYVQDVYEVQIIVSGGNFEEAPYRNWPPQDTIGERDRIISPADSVRAITVGSIALNSSINSIVKVNEPSPFSRRGPGANYIIKPDVVDYGGNIANDYSISNLGMKGLNEIGGVYEGIGTSYSTPRIVQKFASVYDDMIDQDLLLTKALIIHSANINTRNIMDQSSENIKYFGFGLPSSFNRDIVNCCENEITLVFRQKILSGTHLEMIDFPFPASLMKEGKCFGEISMTLAYNPVLDLRFGCEYCRTNVDVSFGTFKHDSDGDVIFTGRVPLECTWDERFEKSRVENGFKWSPIKSYFRKIGKKGIDVGEGWKIRLDLTARNEANVNSQEFVLIVTIKDQEGHDIYSEVVNGLRAKGYTTNNLETKAQVRQRL